MILNPLDHDPREYSAFHDGAVPMETRRCYLLADHRRNLSWKRSANSVG